MNEQQQESLSALFDGEVSDFEVRRVLAEVDADARGRWQRYQLISSAVAHKLDENLLTINVADAVAAEIADEPVLKAASGSKPSRSWLKPVVGFAAAASIAFVSVVGIQTLDDQSPVNGFIANGNVSASQLPIIGGTGLNQASAVADINLATQINDIDAEKQQEQARINYYLQQHAQNASFNNGRGLLPMARMSKEEY